ncbi:cytochrome c biogenesis protein ResB [Puniceicoccaceae bacterium K14]|nr:cytochrome c biogenesis protein ResB [Puniceicoccaceae bacterium K14]
MNKLGKQLASPKIFFFTAIWLLIILVKGTLAQKDIGLYQSQEYYFSSWFIMVGGLLPLPGGRLAMAVMFINLLSKLLFSSKFSVARIGTHIAHFGGLLLLVGGFITAYYSKEGSMMLYEGDKSAFFDDYHELEIAIIDTSNPAFDEVTAFRNEYIDTGAVISDPSFPGTIKVVEYHRNADLYRLDSAVPSEFKGMAQRFYVRGKPLDSEASRNRAAMIVEVEGLSPVEDGVYIIFQHMQVPQLLNGDGRTFELSLRNARYPLPFGIELLDFEKVMHPGTMKAKSYSSEVNVMSGELKRRVEISMNQPMRNRGYTFYQASFVEGQVKEASVFAVVKNAGRQFPYWSSIIMSIGLFIHIVLRVIKHVNKGEKA